MPFPRHLFATIVVVFPVAVHRRDSKPLAELIPIDDLSRWEGWMHRKRSRVRVEAQLGVAIRDPSLRPLTPVS